MPEAEFDFDYWSQLARRDPATFFAEREKLIQDFIDSAPPEHRETLLATQRLIDGTRAQAGSPLKAVRQMMGMMADHLEAMRGQLEQLRQETDRLGETVGRIQQG
ncbi:DUF3135 domain-containing protein [Viridibacterium curvum]|uniref:DUF3135 domain-containing protein n=1 Tax=Viridibacterium curvum TaxID=1101404 RepID=A0ABP9Q7X9_9RHOO